MNDYYNPTGPTSQNQPTEPDNQAANTGPKDQSQKPKATSPADSGQKSTPLDAARSASSAEDSYNAFVKALIVDLGFDKAGEEEKSRLAEAIKRRVEARVLRVLMSSLTDEQRAELDREITEKGLKEDAIIKLLSEKAPAAASTILSALNDLYTEMKEETDILWQAAAAKTASKSEER